MGDKKPERLESSDAHGKPAGSITAYEPICVRDTVEAPPQARRIAGDAGKLEKPPRKFAPKRPVKREPQSTDASAPSSIDGGVGGSGGTGGGDDPFAALMEQAKAAVKAERHPGAGGGRRGSKFSVAFGGGAEDVALGELKHKLIKGDPTKKSQAGKPGAGDDKKAAKPGKPGVGAKPSTGTAAAQDEDMELFDDPMHEERPQKQREPLFDRHAYYPSVVPFVPVDVPHDPNAIMHDSGIPPDLAVEEPEEVSAAEELGLEAAPDGHMLLLQLPPLLPSVPLFEAGQRAALEEPAPPSTPPLPDGAKPHPKFAVGPDVLKHIPSGKIGSVVLTRSGRVRLRVGCASYDVTAGVPAQHRSEVHLVNMKTKDIVLAAADLPAAVAALDLETLATD